MIYLLDSNVVSELWKPQPNASVIKFFEHAEWFIPSVVIAEIQEGAEASPSAARREEINRHLDQFLSLHSAVIVSWDSETARTWGRLKHSLETKRQPQALWDSLIDAMGVRLSATIATRDTQGFRHARTFSPFSEHLPPELSA